MDYKQPVGQDTTKILSVKVGEVFSTEATQSDYLVESIHSVLKRFMESGEIELKPKHSGTINFLCKEIAEAVLNVQECDANGLNQGTEPMANNSLEETTEPEKREEQQQFLEYIDNTRKEFVKKASEDWWMRIGVERVVFEDVLIAYDQMRERLGDSSKGGDLEVSDRSPDESSVASHTSTPENK